MDFLYRSSELLPILMPSQSVSTRTGQSISTAVSPRLSIPSRARTPSLQYWNQNTKEGRTDSHKVHSDLVINAYG